MFASFGLWTRNSGHRHFGKGDDGHVSIIISWEHTLQDPHAHGIAHVLLFLTLPPGPPTATTPPSGNVDTVRALVEHGASLKQLDFVETPLRSAIRHDQPEMVRLLVRDCGLDPRADPSRPPLVFWPESPGMLRLLVQELGLDPNTEDNGVPVLMARMRRTPDNLPVIQALLELQADPDARGRVSWGGGVGPGCPLAGA